MKFNIEFYKNDRFVFFVRILLLFLIVIGDNIWYREYWKILYYMIKYKYL